MSYKYGHIFEDPNITDPAIKSGLDELDYLSEMDIYNRDNVPCINTESSPEFLAELEKILTNFHFIF